MTKPSSSSSIPSTMRAWAHTARGKPRDVLRLKTIPSPRAPRDGEVLIRVSHTTLTPAFSDLMAVIPAFVRRGRPAVPEIDFCGEIAAAGPRVPVGISTPGTRVFGNVTVNQMISGEGAMAEYILVNAAAACVRPPPPSLSLAKAAGLSSNGQTALQMLQTAGVKTGHRVFVNGGSTGVGIVLIQALKLAGAYVVATGSGEKVDLVKSLGADEVVDYRVHAPLEAHLAATYASAPFDIFMDTVGVYALYVRCPAFTKRTAMYLNVGALNGPFKNVAFMVKATLWPALLGGTPRKYVFQNTVCRLDVADELVRLVDEGALKILVDKVFDMDDALMAYDRSMSKRATGKVVVKIQDL